MIFERLKTILTDEEMTRLQINTGNTGMEVIADVHGMKCAQAKRFINNIINLIHDSFQLIIIHGYNHGTAIRDMLSTNFSNHHISKQYLDAYNQGVTHMFVFA